MTWHLKDRELEKKLIEICPNFLECIDFAIQTKEKDTNYIYVEFDRERENDTLGFNYLYFWDDELEEVPEYNPHAWNEYPAVIPPENVWMRLEIFRTDIRSQRTYRDAAIFLAGKWRNGESVIEISEGDEVRFRSWC